MAFKKQGWPLPRQSTLDAISAETVIAREAFQTQLHTHIDVFAQYVGTATNLMLRHHEPEFWGDRAPVSAVEVWSAWVKVAALAVRIIEEGSREYSYAKRGYEPFPENPLPPQMEAVAEKFRKSRRANGHGPHCQCDDCERKP